MDVSILNDPLMPEAPKTTPQADRIAIFRGTLWLGIGYLVLSAVTVPFVGAIWLGELPLLALIQLPKLTLAAWACEHIFLNGMSLLGLSLGSFSPDYLVARPYALALVYVLPMSILGVVGMRRINKRQRLLTVAFLGAGAVDYVLTLLFVNTRSLSLY